MIRWLRSLITEPGRISVEDVRHPENHFRVWAENLLPTDGMGSVGYYVGKKFKLDNFTLSYNVGSLWHQPRHWGHVYFSPQSWSGPAPKWAFRETFRTREEAVLKLARSLQLIDEGLGSVPRQLTNLQARQP